MSRDYTNYLKGIAILSMLFLHLFDDEAQDLKLNYWIAIDDIPLVYYLSRMCNPVSLYLILSGYGLYASYQTKGNVNVSRRLFYLYGHLWIIYLLLLPFASMLHPEYFPGTIKEFIQNALSWKCTYIREQWFFLPYLVIMASSKWLFRLLDKLNNITIFITALAIYIVSSYCLKRFGNKLFDENMALCNLTFVLYMVLPFVLGYMAKRNYWLEKNILRIPGNRRNLKVCLLLIAICILRCSFEHISINPFFYMVFIMLFSLLPIGRISAFILGYLGKYSMNIWLIHMWFVNNLMHNFIYETVRTPLLMYLFVLLISFVFAFIVERIYLLLLKRYES